MVLRHGTGEIRVTREERGAEEPGSHRPGEAEDHPGDRNAAGIRDHADRTRRHKADENVRLTAVAKTPGEKRNDADRGLTVHHAQHIRVDRGDLVRGGGRASEIDHDGDRRHHKRDAHEGRLNRIGPGHREEPTDKDVGDRRDSAEPERGGVGEMERVLEKPGAGHHAGGAVDREENENHGRGAHGEPV